MKICITTIKVNSISSIGSFNIGKTIICRNQSTVETEVVEPTPPRPGVPGYQPGVIPPDIAPGLIQAPPIAMVQPPTPVADAPQVITPTISPAEVGAALITPTVQIPTPQVGIAVPPPAPTIPGATP